MKPFLCLAACAVMLLTACQRPATTEARKSAAGESRTRPVAVLVGATRSTQAQAAPSAQAASGQRVTGGTSPIRRVLDPPFKSTEVARFVEPWAMTFLPDGRLLVTEKQGHLKLIDVASGQKGEISGVPAVAYGGQGGFGDVVLHPQFASNRLV
ncbi:MAG: PQQ-dependent sugar dehydrogenase, partial [Pseudoxanthomonas sp.]